MNDKNKIKIISRISHGLGNQMFQYAIGLALSSRNNAELLLDVSFFQNNHSTAVKRNFFLKNFNISGNIAEKSDIFSIGLPDMENNDFFGKVKRKIFRIGEYFKPINKKKFVIEPYFHFCPDILKIKNSCYLSGDWQSEKYFSSKGGYSINGDHSNSGEKNIEDIIRKKFTLKNKPTEKTKNLINKAKVCDSISIHIRRGDYISSPKTNQFHGACTPDYYKTAIKYIAKNVKNPVFFIFSDDIDWAKDNFKSDYPIYFVSNKIIPDYEELIIMSKCKHNIIANSSFSWWGAWLNENKDKIVIAPKEWFKVKNINTSDLIPKSWITI